MEIIDFFEQPDINDLMIFAYIARGSRDIWRMIEIFPVRHRTFGPGWITKMETNNLSGELFIEVEFTDGPTARRFTDLAFVKGFFSFHVPPDKCVEFANLIAKAHREYSVAKKEKEEQDRLEQERLARIEQEKEQKQKEEAGLRQFASLRKAYFISSVEDTSVTSPLFPILLRMEDGDGLSEDELDWLEKKRLYSVLAIHYEREYDETGDGWCLVNAWSNWRKARLPRKVTEYHGNVMAPDPKLRAALFTARGGACRDLGELYEAEQFARKAIAANPESHHPYNLLGAICFQSGRPEEGEVHIQNAILRGAQPKETESMIFSSVRAATPEDCERTAQYLLKKDPEQYAWAEHYLRH